MRKIHGMVLAIIGIITVLFGIVLKIKENTVISVIGGADGPTSVFVAGKTSSVPVIISVILGIILLVIGIFIIIRKNKN